MNLSEGAMFINVLIEELYETRNAGSIKVLDFGCGSGNLVKELAAIGYDSYGCDIEASWNSENLDATRLRLIQRNPYRLLYPDSTFDVVISKSVLEHAKNKHTCFLEIRRVLRPGGCAIHLFPPKWYLPAEPHTFVPLLNYFYPACPRWWLSLWAWLGIRNEFQKGLHWKEVVERNLKYCAEGLSYYPNSRHQRLSMEIFGNYSSPMDMVVRLAPGRTAAALRYLPFYKFTGWLVGELRTKMIVQRKTEI